MPDGDGAIPQSPLTASLAAGESSPVIVLSGEADLTCAGQLSALITAQLAGGSRQLTIDVSELRFANSASIRTLVLAARTLRERGGSLVLLRPRRPVARVLALTGAEQMFTIREETHGLADTLGSDVELTVRNRSKNADIAVRHRLSPRQVAMVLAGGQIPLVRSRQAS